MKFEEWWETVGQHTQMGELKRLAWLGAVRPEEIAQIKAEADGYAEKWGNARSAWKALREHIGNDVLPGSRFERLIWLMEAAVEGAPPSPQGTAPPR